MEKNGERSSFPPTAPMNYYPPPSYEESQRMTNGTATAPYYQPPVPAQMTSHAPPHVTMQHARPPIMAHAPPPYNNTPHVMYLARGARLHTTANGTLSIPPPPPGCAPTAAQLAAMQGAPVIVKKKKNTFF